MGAIGRTIRRYILWTYDRGTVHYDIMVTLILVFIFASPFYIKYGDKPVVQIPHPTGVVVMPDAASGFGFIYQIDAAAVTTAEDSSMRDEMLRVIEPISGDVTVVKYEPVRDASGKVVSYKVWVRKP